MKWKTAEWDLSLALIRPHGWAWRVAHRLLALCEKVERAWVSPEWNITRRKGQFEWRKRWQDVDDVTDRLQTGPCVMNESVTFYIGLRCFHPVTSTNVCWMQSKSSCCKWIGGYFSWYYFCISPLNKHWLREGLVCFSSELVSHSNKIDVYRPVSSCSHQRSCGSIIDWQVHWDTLLVIASALAHHYINISGWPQRAESVVVTLFSFFFFPQSTSSSWLGSLMMQPLS